MGAPRCHRSALRGAAVLFGMRLARLGRVVSGMSGVPMGDLCVMRRLFVVASRVVLGGFLVMLRRSLVMRSRTRVVVCRLWCGSHVVLLDICPRNTRAVLYDAREAVPLG